MLIKVPRRCAGNCLAKDRMREKARAGFSAAFISLFVEVRVFLCPDAADALLSTEMEVPPPITTRCGNCEVERDHA